MASSMSGPAAGAGLHWRESGPGQDDGAIEMACLGPVGQPQPGGAGSGGPLVLMAPTKAGGGAGVWVTPLVKMMLTLVMTTTRIMVIHVSVKYSGK